MSGHKRSAGYPRTGIRIAAIAALTAASPSLAAAADWSIVYKNDTSFSLTDNIRGTATDKEVGIEINNDHAVDLLARTKTDLFRVTPTLSIDTSLFEDSGFDPQYFPGITAEYSRTGKLTNFSVNTFFNYTEVTSSDFDNRLQRILFDEEGTQLSYGANTNLSRMITKRDTLTWGLNYSTAEYSSEITTLEPSDTYSTTFGWQRSWTQLTSTTLSSTIAFVDPDPYLNARNPVTGRPLIDPVSGDVILRTVTPSERIEWETTFGVDTKLTKRLSGGAKFGVSLIDEKDAALSSSFIYSLNATYQPLKNTSFTFGAERNFSVAEGGGTEGTYNLNFGARHAVNDLTSLGFNVAYSLSPQTGPDESELLISPSISYKPAKDWDTTLSYEFSSEDEDGETTVENAVILKVSYGKTLLK